MEEKILEILKKMDARFDKMDARLDKMDARLDKMDARLDRMDARFEKVEEEIGEIKTEVVAIKTQQEENTLILRALEHKADVNKAEHDKMILEISGISGDVKSLRKDVSKVEVV